MLILTLEASKVTCLQLDRQTDGRTDRLTFGLLFRSAFAAEKIVIKYRLRLLMSSNQNDGARRASYLKIF